MLLLLPPAEPGEADMPAWWCCGAPAGGVRAALLLVVVVLGEGSSDGSIADVSGLLPGWCGSCGAFRENEVVRYGPPAAL